MVGKKSPFRRDALRHGRHAAHSDANVGDLQESIGAEQLYWGDDFVGAERYLPRGVILSPDSPNALVSVVRFDSRLAIREYLGHVFGGEDQLLVRWSMDQRTKRDTASARGFGAFADSLYAEATVSIKDEYLEMARGEQHDTLEYWNASNVQ